MTHINEHKRIHLIGIGGCSMSGLASILKNRGCYVQGMDSGILRLPLTEIGQESFETLLKAMRDAGINV